MNESVGPSNNSIYIEYHGEQKNRFYVGRESILKGVNFDPSKDITRLETGLYKLNNIKLKHQISSYFYARDEDGFIGVVNKNLPFRNKILQLILNKNPDFDITKSELANLCELEYTKTPEPHTQMPHIPLTAKSVIIASKVTEEFFAIKRIKADAYVVIDKSNFPQKTTIRSNMGSRNAETYLSFIIKNYERLPELCIFLSDSIKQQNREYQSMINNVVTNLEKSEVTLTYLTRSFRNCVVTHDVHVKGTLRPTPKTKEHINTISDSNYNYINWVSKFISDKKVTLLRRTIGTTTQNMIMRDGLQMIFNPCYSFLIAGDKFQRREKSFYEKLYSQLISHSDTEAGLYINRSWDLIFG